MRAYDLSQVTDETLLRDLTALVAQDRSTTALLLAHIAEVDARKLYLPAAYASMHAYCVEKLHLSDDAAYRRMQAARAARRFPVLFSAVADGRLHLTAVCLLAPHLTPENVKTLVAAATHRRKAEIELWLARNLAPSDSPLAGVAAGPMASSLAPAQVEKPSRTISLHLQIDAEVHAKWRYAQNLLSHAVPSGEPAEVLDRALDALISQLEKRKFAATSRAGRIPPRPDEEGPLPNQGTQRTTRRQTALPGHTRPTKKPRPRSLPAHVRRAVWARDRGQCTFTSPSGRRCGSRKRLEFDHVVPVAKGGRATVQGLRLLCRGHNQYEAERAFGAEFMRGKREHPRHPRTPSALAARDGAAAPEVAVATAPGVRAPDHAEDVRSALRGLGFRAPEARQGSEYAATLAHSTLEDRLQATLRFLGRSSRSGLRSRRLASAMSG